MTKTPVVEEWVDEAAALTRPSEVVWMAAGEEICESYTAPKWPGA